MKFKTTILALIFFLCFISCNKDKDDWNDKVASYLPEYAGFFAETNKNNVEIENCLTMTMGFKWDEWGANDLSLLWK